MPQLFYVQIDLHGQPADWQFHALHNLMQSEGFLRKERQLTPSGPLSETIYLGRRDASEDALRDSLRNRIAESVWGLTQVKVSPLRA